MLRQGTILENGEVVFPTKGQVWVDDGSGGDNPGGGNPSLGAGVNRSGTIIAAGVSQQIAPANPLRKSLIIQNISTQDLWVSEHGAATKNHGSNKIGAGLAGRVSSSNAITILGDTIGQEYTATEVS